MTASKILLHQNNVVFFSSFFFYVQQQWYTRELSRRIEVAYHRGASTTAVYRLDEAFLPRVSGAAVGIVSGVKGRQCGGERLAPLPFLSVRSQPF